MRSGSWRLGALTVTAWLASSSTLTHSALVQPALSPSPAQGARASSDSDTTRIAAGRKYGWAIPICWTPRQHKKVICTNVSTLSVLYPQSARQMGREVQGWLGSRRVLETRRAGVLLDSLVGAPAVIACGKGWRTGTVTIGHGGLREIGIGDVKGASQEMAAAAKRIRTTCGKQQNSEPSVEGVGGGESSALGVVMESFVLVYGSNAGAKAYEAALKKCQEEERLGPKPGSYARSGDEAKKDTTKKPLTEKEKKALAARKEAQAKADSLKAAKAAEEKRLKEAQTQAEKKMRETNIKMYQQQIDYYEKRVKQLDEALKDIKEAAVEGLRDVSGDIASGDLELMVLDIAKAGAIIYIRGIQAFTPPPQQPRDCMEEECHLTCEQKANAAAWKAMFWERMKRDNCMNAVLPNPEGNYKCPGDSAGLVPNAATLENLLKHHCEEMKRIITPTEVAEDVHSCETPARGEFLAKLTKGICGDPSAMCAPEQGSPTSQPLPVARGRTDMQVWVPGRGEIP
jgi:hypothetical protein